MRREVCRVGSRAFDCRDAIFVVSKAACGKITACCREQGESILLTNRLMFEVKPREIKTFKVRFAASGY
jgi:hypothetical protein